MTENGMRVLASGLRASIELLKKRSIQYSHEVRTLINGIVNLSSTLAITIDYVLDLRKRAETEDKRQDEVIKDMEDRIRILEKIHEPPPEPDWNDIMGTPGLDT